MMVDEFYINKFIIITLVNKVNIYPKPLETGIFYLFLSVHKLSNNSSSLRE